MVSILNMHDSIKKQKKTTSECQHFNTNHISIICGNIKLRDSLYTRVISCMVIAILNHITTMMILPTYDSSCMAHRTE